HCHARKHRVAPGRKTGLQAVEGVREKRAHQEPSAISANVSRVDRPAGKILGAGSERARVAEALEERPEMESALRAMVRGRETKSFGELPRSSSQRSDEKQGRDSLGRRTRRQARPDLSAIASRRLP